MPIFVICQMVNPTFSDKQALALFPTCPSQWPATAKLQANDLEHAFALSQHTDEEWHLQPYVVEMGFMPADGYGPRSTSVGDVVIDPQGLPWVVGRFGFKRILALEPA